MSAVNSLPSILDQQLVNFIKLQRDNCLARYGDASDKKEVNIYFDWILEFARKYCISRIQRADDIGSHQVETARKLAWEFIGSKNHDFFATCVDGRNMPTVMFSKVPHVGGVLRAPAGTVTGFMEGTEPKSVFIDDESFVVGEITRLLLEKPGETIFYGLDSHLGCAARGLIHSTEGGRQKDAGLRSDVMAKIMTAKGILKLAVNLQKKHADMAEIIPVFFSYDPHTGFVVAGLEANIDDPVVTVQGYTEDVLNRLAKEGRIVRTSDLIGEKVILGELGEVIEPKSARFREAFSESLLQNWEAIVKLYAEGNSKSFILILKRLEKAYTLSGWKIGRQDILENYQISKRTLQQKAKFLLKNLLTRYSIAGASVHGHWPFDKHQESMAVITDGGYAPFSSLDAFSVFSRDLNALLPNAKLTLDLIRDFRRKGNSLDPVPEMKLMNDQFEAAPVLVVDKAILRVDDERLWQLLLHIDFNQVVSNLNWDDKKILSWNKDDIHKLIFSAVLDRGTQINSHLAQKLVTVVWELFDRTRIMMKDKTFRHMILHGNIVLVNLIVDSDRRPRIIVPFIG